MISFDFHLSSGRNATPSFVPWFRGFEVIFEARSMPNLKTYQCNSHNFAWTFGMPPPPPPPPNVNRCTAAGVRRFHTPGCSPVNKTDCNTRMNKHPATRQNGLPSLVLQLAFQSMALAQQITSPAQHATARLGCICPGFSFIAAIVSSLSSNYLYHNYMHVAKGGGRHTTR